MIKIISSRSQDCRKDGSENSLTICPNCNGNRFNDKIGLCLDCGYDEKARSEEVYSSSRRLSPPLAEKRACRKCNASSVIEAGRVNWPFRMIARFQDEFETIVNGDDEADCMYRIGKLEDAHGLVVWYSGYNEPSEGYFDGEYDPNYEDDIFSASYGGAFDIEDDQYFTRDDLVEFGEEVCNHLDEIYPYVFDVEESYIDDNKLHFTAYCDELGEASIEIFIDMRKVRKPSDLKYKYAAEVAGKLRATFDRYYRDINSANDIPETAIDVDDYDELEIPDQEYDSAKTSINSKKLPAIYNMVNFVTGSVGIDYGGGKFDNAVEYLADQGVTLYVYDPYNRTPEHNKEALRALRANGGADFALNSNVLNVIKEPEARIAVLKNIKKITKPGAPIYITVYEGSGTGNEGATKSGYQLNRKTVDYLDEIREVFPDAKRRGKLITATNGGSVNSATNIHAAHDYDQKSAAIEELAMSGEVSLGRCSKSTLYRWCKEINERLEHGNYDWRVKADPADNSLIAIGLDDPIESATNIDKDMEFNDRYFPRVDVTDTKSYDTAEQGDNFFAYDKKYHTLFYLFKDDEEVLELGWDNAPWRELDSVGLSPANWYNLDAREEYLAGYASDLESEASYLAQDFIENELPYIKNNDESAVKTNCSTSSKKVNAMYRVVPDYNIDPPEDFELDEVEDTLEIDIEFINVKVSVDSTGSWDYESLDFIDIPKDGKLLSNEYSIEVSLDKDSVSEDLDEVIETYVPGTEGEYYINGAAALVYNITNIKSEISDERFDERHGFDYDETIYSDDAEITIDKDESKVDVIFTTSEVIK